MGNRVWARTTVLCSPQVWSLELPQVLPAKRTSEIANGLMDSDRKAVGLR